MAVLHCIFRAANRLALLAALACSLGFSRPAPAMPGLPAVPTDTYWFEQCADCPDQILRVGDESLVIDPQGGLHLAVVGEQVLYAYSDGFSWQVEPVAPAPALVYGPHRGFASIGVAPSGALYIAYLNPSNTAILVATHTPGGWNSITVDNASNGYILPFETALDIDAQGRPCVAYAVQIDRYNTELRLACYDGAGWNVEAVDQAGWTEMYFSLEFDHANQPHITYFTAPAAGTRLRYAYKQSGAWVKTTVEATTWVGEFNTLALDSQDHPHIAYLNVSTGKLRYAHWDGTAWQFQDVDDSPWWGGFASIQVDSQDRPLISYTNQSNLRLAQLTEAGWQIQPLNLQGLYTALALDTGDRPLVAAYIPGTNGLRLAAWNGSAWNQQTVAQIRQVGPGHTLALDAADQPAASYVDMVSNRLMYAALQPDGWQPAVIDTAGAGGGYPSLAFDAQNNPAVSYYAAGSGDLRFARLQAGQWQTQTVAAAGDAGLYNSLAFNTAGQPRISFYDRTAGDLRYAAWNGSQWDIQTVDSADNTGLYTSLALDSLDQPIISYNSKSSDSLRLAYWNGSAWITETVAAGAGPGASLALDALGQPHFAYGAAGGLTYARPSPGGWLTETVTSTTGADLRPGLAFDTAGHPWIAFSSSGGQVFLARGSESGWQIQTVRANGAEPILALDSLGLPHISIYEAGQRALKVLTGLPQVQYLPLVRR